MKRRARDHPGGFDQFCVNDLSMTPAEVVHDIDKQFERLKEEFGKFGEANRDKYSITVLGKEVWTVELTRYDSKRNPLVNVC